MSLKGIQPGQRLGLGPALMLSEVVDDTVDDFLQVGRDGDVVIGSSLLEERREDLVGGADLDELGRFSALIGMHHGRQPSVCGLDLDGRGVAGQA